MKYKANNMTTKYEAGFVTGSAQYSIFIPFFVQMLKLIENELGLYVIQNDPQYVNLRREKLKTKEIVEYESFEELIGFFLQSVSCSSFKIVPILHLILTRLK